MKRILLFISLILLSTVGFSQEDLTDDELYAKYGTAQFGPNKKNYIHTLFNVGLILGSSEGLGAEIDYGKSHTMSVGLRYRAKFNKIFSIGFSFQYKNATIYLTQSDAKLFPNNIIHESEKLSLNSIDGDLFFRFNISSLDNTLGTYIDLGAYGGYIYYSNHQFTDNNTNVNPVSGNSTFTVVNHNPNYILNYNYGLLFRFGYNHIEFFGKYNLSGIFTKEYKTQFLNIEMPRIEVGMGFNI